MHFLTGTSLPEVRSIHPRTTLPCARECMYMPVHVLTHMYKYTNVHFIMFVLVNRQHVLLLLESSTVCAAGLCFMVHILYGSHNFG